MAIEAKLYIEDQVYTILDYRFSILQKTDHTGRPTNKPNGGVVHIEVEGGRDTQIFEWSTHPTMMKNCKIVISSRYGTGKSRTIELLDCHCVYSRDHINTVNDKPYTINFSISAATMVNDGHMIFSKFWKLTDLSRKDVPITERASNKKLTDYYLTDDEGNKINEYETGQTIILYIATSNRIGDKITINLNDKEHDFKYNGTILKNDTIKEYLIGSDLEEIQLEVIDQQEAV